MASATSIRSFTIRSAPIFLVREHSSSPCRTSSRVVRALSRNWTTVAPPAIAALSTSGTILLDAGLSFLGIGLRPPITSLGVLLKEAQNVTTIALYPWLLIPVLFVIAIVLSFNFVGDGLRDALDPTQRKTRA